MNCKRILVGFISILLLVLTGSLGFVLGTQQRPVYNRVYTSNHKSIEKAMRNAGIEVTNEQLEDMYRSLKDEH